MSSDPSLDLRVGRLENGRDALYDLVAGIASVQQEHSRRFYGIDARLDGIDVTLHEIVRRLPEPAG